jgi:hypothetical protein
MNALEALPVISKVSLYVLLGLIAFLTLIVAWAQIECRWLQYWVTPARRLRTRVPPADRRPESSPIAP